MQYIQRTLEEKFSQEAKEYSCLLLTGPRQVGKTTTLEHLIKTGNEKRNIVTLDDFTERQLASEDPEMFLKLHPAPLLVDEAQYAPQLFPYIKMAIDKGAPPGSFWLTGSQKFRLMTLARESLAGRVGIFEMWGLSQSEISGLPYTSCFTLELKELKERESTLLSLSVQEIYERIFSGSLPALLSGKYSDREFYYSNYVRTYIERDILDEDSKIDALEFADFIKCAASRIGQILNVHDLASDLQIRDEKAKAWLLLLEKSGIIFYLHPYSNNLLKRTIKAPKLYFFDTGLAAYLTRYPNAEVLMTSALNGPILENYVIAEIIKTYANVGKDCSAYYYRDKDKREIDLILDYGGSLHPIEIKKTANPSNELFHTFRVLEKAGEAKTTGAVICMKDRLSALDKEKLIIPAWLI